MMNYIIQISHYAFIQKEQQEPSCQNLPHAFQNHVKSSHVKSIRTSKSLGSADMLLLKKDDAVK